MSHGDDAKAAAQRLWLVRTLPDLRSLACWASSTGQRALVADAGYALHAALRATLGAHAPKPFSVRRLPTGTELIGYVLGSEENLRRAMALAANADAVAAQALGLERADTVAVKPVPDDWRNGEVLSFEARVAPVVRSRAQAGGGYPEIDAAFHPDFYGQLRGDREQAHAKWLARELARGGAASLLAHRVVAFTLTDVARRAQAATGARMGRETRSGLLPDLCVRGTLRIDDGIAFGALLARGLGRHRSFGYGCLLVAPAGAWN